MAPSTPAPARLPVDRAGNGTRTRDPNLGKVVLYQLSYSRSLLRGALTGEAPTPAGVARARARCCRRTVLATPCHVRPDGGEGNRTPDLLNAIQALSQLSYAPVGHPDQRCLQETASLSRGILVVKEMGLAQSEGASILQRP